MTQKNGIQIVLNLFNQFIGEKARNVKLGYGSFVTIDFGKDLILKEKVKGKESIYIQGEWHLWIYMTAWRLDQRDMPIIGAADDRETIAKNLDILNGKELKKVSILNASFDVLMEFQNDLNFLLFAFGVKEYEQWMLFTPERKVFTAGPGINWSYEDARLS